MNSVLVHIFCRHFYIRSFLYDLEVVLIFAVIFYSEVFFIPALYLFRKLILFSSDLKLRGCLYVCIIFMSICHISESLFIYLLVDYFLYWYWPFREIMVSFWQVCSSLKDLFVRGILCHFFYGRGGGRDSYYFSFKSDHIICVR